MISMIRWDRDLVYLVISDLVGRGTGEQEYVSTEHNSLNAQFGTPTVRTECAKTID